MKKESFISICPQCGSKNTKEIVGLRYTPTTRKCLSCGFIGIFPLIKKSKLKQFQKLIESKSFQSEKNKGIEK